MRVVAALFLLLFVGTLAAEPDPVEQRYRQLLQRDDELAARLEMTAGRMSFWHRAHFRAQMRRLEADYQGFIAQHPQRTDAMVAYGGFLSDQGREEEGVRWWDKAIAVDPRCAKAYNDRATFYGHNGRAADALRDHQRAYELDPGDPIYHFNWATTCILFRKDAAAVYGWDTAAIFRHSLDEFRKARDLAPEEYSYAAAYAESFYVMPQPDWAEALAAWKFCLQQPLDEQTRQLVYTHLARVCLNAQRPDEARQWLAKIDRNDLLSLKKLLTRRLDQSLKPPASSAGGDAPGSPRP